MGSYRINGGRRIEGEYTLAGAKNAVLPILAATIATGHVSELSHCPNLADVKTMLKILESLGCKTKIEKDKITVDSGSLNAYSISDSMMREMRSSVFIMGPMLARCGKVTLSYPGGCEIGLRPIDIHLKALRQLGVKIKEENGFLICTAEKMTGGSIQLDFPSVGATENAMVAAIAADGVTTILNAAKEPEIVDLQNYLNAAGANIKGAGSDVITIKGGAAFHDVQHDVIPDRIEAGTLLAAAAMTGGEILLKNAIPDHMRITLAKIEESGCYLEDQPGRIYLKAPKRLKAVEMIKTLPYPGFPTDMQSQLLTMLTVADGTSLIVETIFENRFKLTEELTRMGARIKTEGRTAIITGVEELTGARVFAKDLRGGASLILAGLAATGETIVENICHIDRGYDKFEETLTKLGADIVRIE